MGRTIGDSGASKIFTTNQTFDGTVGNAFYQDLGVIPIGQVIWFGSLIAISPDKSITFEVRSNNIGCSAGTDAETTSKASIAVSPRKGTRLLDMYKAGRLHIITVVGTGVERFWIKMKSRSGASGAWLFTLNYTEE